MTYPQLPSNTWNKKATLLLQKMNMGVSTFTPTQQHVEVVLTVTAGALENDRCNLSGICGSFLNENAPTGNRGVSCVSWRHAVDPITPTITLHINAINLFVVCHV